MQNFDPAAFKVRYPQFVDIPDQQLTDMFNFEAKQIGSKVIALFSAPNLQYYWACVVLAHLCSLLPSPQGSGQVGRVASASEGSVSGNYEFLASEDDQYWAQTQYGLSILQLFKNRGGFTYFPYGAAPLGSGYGYC